MAELLAAFTTPVASPDGLLYTARACGRTASDGLWHAWLEFIPGDGGEPICSSRETTQPNRVDAEYWASGLTPVYLEGALQRALAAPPSIPIARPEAAAVTVPAVQMRRPLTATWESPLDPFSVYGKGEPLLRKQLGALSQWHLVNVALAYDLADEPLDALNRRSPAYLIELIVSGVRTRQHVDER